MKRNSVCVGETQIPAQKAGRHRQKSCTGLWGHSIMHLQHRVKNTLLLQHVGCHCEKCLNWWPKTPNEMAEIVEEKYSTTFQTTRHVVLTWIALVSWEEKRVQILVKKW